MGWLKTSWVYFQNVGRDPYDFGRLTTSLIAVLACLLTQAPKYFVGGHGAKVSNDATLPKHTLAHKIRLGSLDHFSHERVGSGQETS